MWWTQTMRNGSLLWAASNFHVQGRHHFALTDEAVLRGELRPLRDPDSFEPEALIA